MGDPFFKLRIGRILGVDMRWIEVARYSGKQVHIRFCDCLRETASLSDLQFFNRIVRADLLLSLLKVRFPFFLKGCHAFFLIRIVKTE